MVSLFTYATLSTILISTLSITVCGVSEELVTMRIEKVSHLHFYFHDTVSGKNPTAMQVAGPKGGRFGTTMVMDDPLTEGAERGSKLVGRAQGLYAVAAQQEISLVMVMDFAFMEGKYNGSTLSVVGRNPVLHDVREMPIIGGSGLFRYARGYALAHSVRFDFKTGDAVVQYNVTVLHF